MGFIITAGVSTNSGNYREINEDNFLMCGKILKSKKMNGTFYKRCRVSKIFAVCDGMGSTGYGRIAADTAVINIRKQYRINFDNREVVQPRLNQLIADTSRKIFELKEKGMKTGCTLALVYTAKDKIYYANLGDTRIYSYFNSELEQLSEDHNRQGELRRMGIRGDNLLRGKSELTQYLGISSEEMILEPCFGSLEYREGLLLIASDGLTDALKFQDIEEILKEDYYKRPDKLTDVLVNQAIVNGANDNVTVMIIKISKR